MRTILLFLGFLIATTSWAQDSGKTLVKTMDPKGTSAINFQFRNTGIEASPWDEGFIRVELEITANFPEAVLAQLVKAGRYTLTSSIEGETFYINAENLKKAVTIGGKDLDDQVRVIIKTPGYYAVSDGVLQKNFPGTVVEGLVDRAGSAKEAAAKIKEMRKIKEKIDVQYKFVYKRGKDDDRKRSSKSDNAKISKSKEPVGTDPGNTGFIRGKEKTLNPNSSLKDVQQVYGDIIIGGMPLDDFND